VAVSVGRRTKPHKAQVGLNMHQMSPDIVEHMLANFTQDELAYLNSCAFLISGGSGFAAEWIVSILYSLSRDTSLPQIALLSRNPDKIAMKYKWYHNLNVVSWQNLTLGNVGEGAKNFVVIHSSVPAASGENILATEIGSYSRNTEILVDAALKVSLKPTLVNLSTGGLYMRPSHGFIGETSAHIKSHNLTPYERVKFNDEEITSRYGASGLVRATNPRLFSFTGPGLRVPGKFAITEFVSDAMSGMPIQIRGNPSSFRSYMSPVDMGVWILKCAIWPSMGVVHLGSSEGLLMSQVAALVGQEFGRSRKVEIQDSNTPPESYVPENTETKKQLRINKMLNFRDSLKFWSGDFGINHSSKFH
jgi:nucleoside-diphosphate-sugar epimerase